MSLLHKSFELDPTFFLTRTFLGMYHARAGRFDEAMAEGREGVRLSAGLPMAVGVNGWTLATCGRREEARAVLAELEAASAQRYVPASARAWCHLGLGETDQALEWIERGAEQRDSQLPHAGVMRVFHALDTNPRFQEVLRRIGVPLPRRSV